ncbi:MAG: phosphoenolpyruvate synthase [Candidatus Magasanikbacteria bacterium]
MSKKRNIKQKALQKKNVDILWFKDIRIGDVSLVGGKNASLGEMYSNVRKMGMRIPNGFAVTANVYWDFLDTSELKDEIKKEMLNLDVKDVRELARVSKRVRDMILKAEIPESSQKSIVQAYGKLSQNKKEKNISVAVRSSATAEDLPGASFAGQQETYLNVVGNEKLLLNVKKCIASLFTSRAISYREAQGFDHMSVALSVTVQEMIDGSHGASGVLFTLDTESGFRGVTLVNASYGLGEYVVKGRVVPDQFYVFDEGLKRGKKALISRTLGSKEVKLVYGKNGSTVQMKVSAVQRRKFSISEDEVLQLAKWGNLLEEHYGVPQDIEWVKDGKTGQLYIVQARPETVRAQESGMVIEKYVLKKLGTELLSGVAVGQKIGAGKVRIIEDPKQMKQFKKGDVLVTRITDPDWEPIMRIASAIVTEQGGKTSHAAIVSRELGVPCVVGASKARKILKNGQQVTVSCAKGDEGIIYRGNLPFEVQRTELKKVPETKTKIMMNIGDPDHAFSLSRLPHKGVGLARLEFIFSNFIKIHPLALLHYKKLKDKKAKKKIKELTYGYADKSEYCVEKLAEGIARIAAAMHPYDVVVRLSDFKTNEYRTLIGGNEFEPKENNPMIGWRGASRYYSKEYKEAFGLECKAIKRVREEWGLTNVIAMVPFCRTPEEGERVLNTMADFGLTRGKDGLQVYVMCEIPSNVILADEFAKIFDGFSIGSNDLTQLTLAVDRDSSLVSHIYDEKHPAVKKLIKDVIAVAHKHGKKVGICGQAPSDYPEFASFLIREGIDSMSLNPDTIVENVSRVAKLEKTIGKTGGKTNTKLLSLVSIVGILAAGLIGLGAGCGNVGQEKVFQEIQESYVAPAELRERAVEKALAEKEKEDAKKMSTLKIRDFGGFQMQYPQGWNVEQIDGRFEVKDPETDGYVIIKYQQYNNLVEYEDEYENEQRIGGRKAFRYPDSGLVGSMFDVVYILVDESHVIEINGSEWRFDEILKTISFLPLEEI